MQSSSSYDALSNLDDGSKFGDKSGICMEWRDINFDIMKKEENRQILQHMSGQVSSSQSVAILGHTGCGKTSLMNILAARAPTVKSQCSLTGNIYINGQLRNDAEFRKISAYVMQDDQLYPHLTVYETLYLASNFYLTSAISHDEKVNLVNRILMDLGLHKCRDTIIGNDKIRGVSGGERKRANIAVQLLSNPAVLFLDEPTSGLDSFQGK